MQAAHECGDQLRRDGVALTRENLKSALVMAVGTVRPRSMRRVAKRITNVGFRESDARLIDDGRLFDAAVGRLVLMFMRDPTATLRQIAERVRPGGIVAFQEWDGRATIASAMNQPVLARLQDIFVRTFERSGARSEIGAELYSRMLDAGLEPDPSPLAEIAVHAHERERSGVMELHAAFSMHLPWV